MGSHLLHLLHKSFFNKNNKRFHFVTFVYCNANYHLYMGEEPNHIKSSKIWPTKICDYIYYKRKKKKALFSYHINLNNAQIFKSCHLTELLQVDSD